ncbi:MAG TPA: hypothetical protein VJ547_13025 [Candidatus Thermoplasmatota archaeon]|nr:hypothetical protein [Candidatus Thermoplasmatota archaeon]
MNPARLPLALAALALIALALLWVAAMPAAAHEHVHAHPYEFTLGWTTEPAVVGAPNGVDLRVTFEFDANTSEPVMNAHNDLTATLSFGAASVLKALEPKFGEPGWYTFDVIPTQEGTYSVRITGTLNGTGVNISVDLDPPSARADLEFPVAEPAGAELSAQLSAAQSNASALASRVSSLESGSASLNSAAALAELMAIVGLLAGAAGAALAVMARRTPPKSG